MAAVILCSGVLQWATLTKGHDWGDDFASYIMQARSIVEGTERAFVEANRFTVERSTRMVGPAAAPWGTPVLLAPLYRAFGANMLGLKSLNVACYLLFLVTLAIGLRKRHPFPFLALLVFFFAFNPAFLSYIDGVLSDIPFLLISTVCVFFIGRVAVERRPLVNPALDGVLLGALLAAAFSIRTNGILLVATLAAAHVIAIWRSMRGRAAGGAPSGSDVAHVAPAFRTSWRGALIDCIPYIVFIVLALVWDAAFPKGGTTNTRYLESTSLATVLRHVRSYGKIPSDFFAGVPGPRIVHFVFVPFLLAGMYRSIRAEYHILLYIALNAVLLLVWPYTQGLRYVVPLMPFYIHYLFIGIRWAVEAIGGRRRRVAGAPEAVEALGGRGQRAAGVVEAAGAWRRSIAGAAAVGVLVVIAALFARGSVSRAVDNMRARRAAPVGPYMETAREMFDFVKAGTAGDASIIFFKPRAMRMFTGRPALVVDKPDEIDRGDYLCYYVMKQPFYELPLADVIRLVDGGRLVPVFANADFRVYRVVHSMGRA